MGQVRTWRGNPPDRILNVYDEAFRSMITLAVLLFCATNLAAQEVQYPGRPRYPEGRLAITLGAGIAKYNGEFTDERVDQAYHVAASWNIGPYLRVGMQGERGKLSFNRRWRRNTQSAFEIQFGINANLQVRNTEYQSLAGLVYLDLLPARYFNVYFLGGVGKLWYTPEDYRIGGLYLMPDEPEQSTWVFPAGLGFEVFFSRHFAFSTEVRTNLTLAGDLDAFPSDKVRDLYADREGSGRNPFAAETANDFHFSLTAGVRIYLFPDNDIDGDGLRNDEEERLGTNPYDQDTDGDGLSDWYETMQLRSDPFRKDSDDDGLTDFEEAIKYRSRPDTLDSDADGLIDSDEVQTWNTNPNVADTDVDDLPDGQEVLLGTNPNKVDTDGDGLSDGEEIRRGTNPLLPDSDGDGLRDDVELFTNGTDPTQPDTDEDGLTDFEEVTIHRSDPLKRDTDGDTLSDFEEVRVTGTDPLRTDTDGDGLRDDVDKCPRLPETWNGYQDEDGCTDGKEK